MSSKRIVRKLYAGECCVIVRYDPEWSEFTVTPRWGFYGEDENATYHTDDRYDAISTGEHMLQELVARSACD